MNLNTLCIYCGSRVGLNPAFAQAAAALGTTLSDAGIDIVYGGSSRGMMGAVANAALDNGGRVIGILPEGLASREKAHPNLTEMHVVESMHQRKALMEKLSDGFIALPGGMGTFEELCEVTTWAQLGIHQKPLGILNVDGYFDHFLVFLDHAVDMGFFTSEHRDLLLVDDDPSSLLVCMQQFEPFLKKIWLDKSEI